MAHLKNKRSCNSFVFSYNLEGVEETVMKPIFTTAVPYCLPKQGVFAGRKKQKSKSPTPKLSEIVAAQELEKKEAPIVAAALRHQFLIALGYSPNREDITSVDWKSDRDRSPYIFSPDTQSAAQPYNFKLVIRYCQYDESHHLSWIEALRKIPGITYKPSSQTNRPWEGTFTWSISSIPELKGITQKTFEGYFEFYDAHACGY